MPGLRNKSIVPVLMFHSIGRTNSGWVWSDMSESVETFEQTLAGLSARGFHTIGLDELYDYMAGKARLSKNSVVLTFDDGYLDNWVNAVPLLRKYGMRGTVYVTPEFVEPSDTVRPTLEDIWAGTVETERLADIGFMNWAELREVDREGVLDVQSHALTHTWYFSSPRVIDIHRPRNVYPYPWLSWNSKPARKPYYLSENQEQAIEWGFPIFEHEKSLVTKRFTPDPAIVEDMQDFVRKAGGKEFFQESDWRVRLKSRFPVAGDSREFPGKYESDDEYSTRVTHELVKSKEILESRLSKVIPYLSFPGGGVNDQLTGIASEAGYKSWTLSSWQERSKRNVPGANPESIKRVTGRSKVHWHGKWIANGGAWWIIQRMLTHQGSILSKGLGALRKIAWIAAVGPGVRAEAHTARLDDNGW